MALDHLYELAQKYYVEDMMAPADISKKLKCSVATIRNWMADGNWVAMRKDEIKTKHKLLSQSKSITMLLGNKIERLLKDDLDVPAQLLNAYSRLASGLYKTKEFESKEIEEELSNDTDTSVISDKTKHALKKAGFIEEEDEV